MFIATFFVIAWKWKQKTFTVPNTQQTGQSADTHNNPNKSSGYCTSWKKKNLYIIPFICNSTGKTTGKKTGGFQQLQRGAAGGRGMATGRNQEAPMCAGKFHYHCQSYCAYARLFHIGKK